MRDRQLLTLGVVAALFAVSCDRLTEPTIPTSGLTVTSSPPRSPLKVVVRDGPPVAARLQGNNHLTLHGAGWQELYGVALLTVPTGGGSESYVNATVDGSFILVHTPSVVQLTDVNIILDAYGLTGSHTLISFRVMDELGNLIQERVLDSPLVLR